MDIEFRRCVETGKIMPFPRGKDLVKKELSVAQSDLSDATAGFDEKRYKWSTIQAYYAMFHAARALLYSRGYREKSHYCLAIALRALFVEENLLAAGAVNDFRNAMNLREAADYEADFSEAAARATIAAAEKFLEQAGTALDVRK